MKNKSKYIKIGPYLMSIDLVNEKLNVFIGAEIIRNNQLLGIVDRIKATKKDSIHVKLKATIDGKKLIKQCKRFEISPSFNALKTHIDKETADLIADEIECTGLNVFIEKDDGT